MICDVVTSLSLYFSSEEGALSMRRPNFIALASCRGVHRVFVWSCHVILLLANNKQKNTEVFRIQKIPRGVKLFTILHMSSLKAQDRILFRIYYLLLKIKEPFPLWCAKTCLSNLSFVKYKQTRSLWSAVVASTSTSGFIWAALVLKTHRYPAEQSG